MGAMRHENYPQSIIIYCRFYSNKRPASNKAKTLISNQSRISPPPEKIVNTRYKVLSLSQLLQNSENLTLKLAGGFVKPPPLVFSGLKFSPQDQLANAFAQLFLDNEDIF